MKTHIISVRINDETYDYLVKVSENGNMPISTVVNRMIETYFSIYRKVKKLPKGVQKELKEALMEASDV